MLAKLREFEVHPLADLFPLVEGQEYEDLRTSVRENGVVNRVTLYQGKILDGRNRMRAAIAEGVHVPTHNLPDDADPVAFVLSQNIMRRHLTPHDRAALAIKVMEISGELERAREEAARRRAGNATKKTKEPGGHVESAPVHEVVAARAGVSPKTAQRVLDEKKADPGGFEKRVAGAAVRSRATLSPHPVTPKKKRIMRTRKDARFLSKVPRNIEAMAAYMRERLPSKDVEKLARLLGGLS